MDMWYSLWFIVIILLIIPLGIDLGALLNTWQRRIKIGRFQTREDWQDTVLQISRKWLQKTPTIKLTDNDRLIIIDILKGNFKRNSIQSWQEASLVLGLTENAKTNDNERIKLQIKQFIHSKIDNSGHWKLKPTESDQAILAYAFLNINFIDHQKYKPAYDETYHMILSLKGEDETVAYKNHKRDFRFVDTIGFICPFLVKYGVQFDIPGAIDLAVKQITEYQKYGMMPQENIPCHTYQVETKIPTGLFGWGRGLGWYVIGLADSYTAIPDNHHAKKYLEDLMIKTARSTFRFQENNGGFHWLLFENGARLDSSTAATLAWFFTVALGISEIAAESKQSQEKAMNYLQSVTCRNGAIDFSQGDTKGIGVYSQNFDILPFTQGFVLRTISQSALHQ